MTTINNGESGLSVRTKLNDIWAGLELNAYDTSIAATAVDVFVYDTSKDSDGGAWRKRTQHTSWYNETLNTATRGSRREFPAVAVIVAESNKVTIYDGDDPALPMWMVFNTTGIFSGNDYNSVAALNGIIVCGEGSGFGSPFCNFIADFGLAQYNASSVLKRSGGIADRNTGTALVSTGLPVIVNSTVNDVAMTVLPDAPIDPATGLPVPTIAVATAGGVSVIKDDGTVVDWTPTGDGDVPSIHIDADGIVTSAGGGIAWKVFFLDEIPASDSSAAPSFTFNESSTPARMGFDGNVGQSEVVKTNSVFALPSFSGTGQKGLNLLTINRDMVAYTTSTFNTGWMNGDIKGAFLADTDDTDLVGSGELVTNGTFDTDTSGWSIGNSNAGNTSLSSVSSQLVVTSSAYDTNGQWAQQSFATVIGQTYVLSFEYVTRTNANGHFARVGGVSITTGSGIITSSTNSSAGVHTLTFTATATTTYVAFGHAHVSAPATSTWDNISVKLADEDRSVNNNGLIVNGTVTRSAVATGAELVEYSGFSASNYLEQPYNSDLDFGTGDFCVMGWAKSITTASSTQTLIFLDDGSYSLRLGRTTSSGATYVNSIYLQAVGAGGTLNLGNGIANTTLSSGVWNFVCVTRVGGTTYVYFNGVLVLTSATAYGDFVTTGTTLRIGSGFTVSGYEMAMSLWRISATAPTADQIRKIYEDEKALFQENAAATLYGASDAVTALAHDPVTDLLHVGTSAGRSVFQGLRRVSNTTTAVGTAISASNSLVVEE